MSNYDLLTSQERHTLNAFNQFILYVPLEQDECIKEITNYGGGRYFISNKGKVYSLCNGRWKELQQQIDTDGYYYVDLYQDGERNRYRIHKLVAMFFLENPENKIIVHHKDFNRKNNNYQNLQFVSVEEHAKIHASKRNETL